MEAKGSRSTNTDPSNPFVHKLNISNLQKVKMCVLGVLLLPIRVIVILVCLTLSTSLAKLGLSGLTPEDVAAAPFTGWRLTIRYAICGILRFMFAVIGFWRVTVIGEQASPSAAPILAVAPHSTYFDALAVTLMGAPSVVAKAETNALPFWGNLIAYTQPLLVHRTDPDSRAKTINTMRMRSEGNRGWQQVLIFPEGTCTNRSALITFRLGAFIPGVPVQPVILRYNNYLDTVTWTWEGISALRVAIYSMTQLSLNLTIEFLPPYSPSQKEIEDPELFASSVRAVMASRMGVPTTDCSYYDYLRIDKASQMVAAFQRLQRRIETPLAEVVGVESSPLELGPDCPELTAVKELCPETQHLRLAVLMATEEDPYETFISRSFAMIDPDLGDERMSESSLRNLAQTFLFLPPKEVNEMVLATSQEGEGGPVSKEKLLRFIPEKRPNYIKVISEYKDGLTKGMETLAMPVSLTAAAEKAQEKANQLMAAGKEVVSDVSATMAASRSKVTDALSSAVTSLHKRTGSRCETAEKKND